MQNPDLTPDELMILETMVVSEMNSILKHGGEEADLRALEAIDGKIKAVLYPLPANGRNV